MTNLKISLNGLKTSIFDVGGQKSERSKWNSLFSNVSYLMFIVSLSDFDQVLFEDNSISRTQDSLELFQTIVTKALPNTPTILVFNKTDIFEKKISLYPNAFMEAYPNFNGDISSKSDVYDHIEQTYMSKLPTDRQAWVHHIYTCATNMDSIFNMMQGIGTKIYYDQIHENN